MYCLPLVFRRLVRERLCGDTSLREDQQLVLADLYSNSLLFGWQTLEQAEKAGAYALIIKDTHDAATGAPDFLQRFAFVKPHLSWHQRRAAGG